MKNVFWILITFIFFPVFYIRIFRNKLYRDKNLKILVIDTAKIGDLVCSTPVFREIKKKFPQSYLAVGIRKQSYGVVQNNPHIDKFIFLNSKKYQRFLGRIKLIKEISKEKFNYSVNLNPHALNTILPFWTGIPNRITSASRLTGRIARLFSSFSNHRLEYKQHTLKLRHNLELLKFLGIKNFKENKEVFISKEERKRAEKFLKKNSLKKSDFLVGITVTAGNKLKEWEPVKFSKLADKLIKELKAKIVFIGVPNDKAIIKRVTAKMRNKAVLVTNFKVCELAALLEKLRLFISVDTGPLYIAHATETPVVDITGPCDINEQPPQDNISELVYKKIDCWPCSFVIPPARECKEKHRRCIKEITVEDVFEAVEKLLKRIYVQKMYNL